MDGFSDNMELDSLILVKNNIYKNLSRSFLNTDAQTVPTQFYILACEKGWGDCAPIQLSLDLLNDPVKYEAKINQAAVSLTEQHANECSKNHGLRYQSAVTINSKNARYSRVIAKKITEEINRKFDFPD